MNEKITSFPRITEACLKQIKDASISEVIRKFVKLKNTGSSLKGLCPFHIEKNPSFVVTESKNLYKCFGCGCGGDAIHFIREHENKSFLEACKTIAEICQISLEYEEKKYTEKEIEKITDQQLQEEVLNYVISKYRKSLFELSEDHPVKKYLFGRGFNDEMISEWQIGWAGTDWRFLTPDLINKDWYEPAKKLGIIKAKDERNYDGYRSRIIIPINDENGRYVGLSGRYIEIEPSDKEKDYPKYINSNESELFNKRAILFGLSRAAKSIRQQNHVVIVEGYFDVISSHRIKRENVLGTCGTSFTAQQITLLKKYTSHVRMMPDNDAAGIKSFNRALPELLKNGFKVEIIEYDQKYKDPDEMICIVNNHTDSEELEEPNSVDALLYRVKNLWRDAGNDPDEKAIAIEEISNLVCCIDNEVKRSAYIDLVQNDLKLKDSILKKQVKKILVEKERKAKEEASKKKFESAYSCPEDVGLVKGFKGNIHDAIKYGIYEHDGILWTRGSGSDRPISNFYMKITYHFLTSDTKAYRMLWIKNVYGFEQNILIDTDDFVSLGNFKKIIARHGDYVFKGNESDLNRLQELLQKAETKSEFVNQMGWNKRHNFYAFCNGIVPFDKNNGHFLPINKSGIVEWNNKHFFIPGMSDMYKEKDDLFESEKKFKYRDPRPGFGFQEWASLFYKTYGDKAMVGISFYLSALFRDIIYEHLGRFPMLNLYGPPQFGKGSFAESLLFMFGEKQAAVSLEAGSTKVGMQRKIAFVINGLVFLDEYKNSINKDTLGALKGIYDGLGRITGKMSNDLQTQVTKVKSAVIVAGQDIPTIDHALYTRMVMLSFDDGIFTDDSRAKLSELQGMEIDGGFSDITAQLLKYRPIVEKEFGKAFKSISEQTFIEVANSEIEDRMINNISILLTIMYLFKDELTMPYSYDDCKTYLIQNMKSQHSILRGNDDVSKFWNIVESLCNQCVLKYGREYLLKDGYLFIKLRLVHPLYIKEMRSRNDPNSLGSVDSLTKYLKLNKQAYVGHTKQRFPDGTNANCDKFKYVELNIELPLFDEKDNPDYHADKEAFMNSKYKEMGIENGKEKADVEVEEGPFPIHHN